MKTQRLADRDPRLSAFISGESWRQAPVEAALREQQTSLGLRDRATKVLRRLDPFIDHNLDVGKRLLSSGAVSDASGEFRDFGDERRVFVAPLEDHLVLCHFVMLKVSIPRALSSRRAPPNDLSPSRSTHRSSFPSAPHPMHVFRSTDTDRAPQLRQRKTFCDGFSEVHNSPAFLADRRAISGALLRTDSRQSPIGSGLPRR